MPVIMLEPDIVTFNAAISACEKSNQWKEANWEEDEDDEEEETETWNRLDKNRTFSFGELESRSLARWFVAAVPWA